jgi:chemotaxis methyl-accepting protein methylase
MLQLRIRSYSEYYHYVASNTEREGEWGELLELLLNKETRFFRHMPSFDALAGQLLPQLLHDRVGEGQKPISMWSVGCSTGQEVYSLAMTFLETVAEIHSGKVWVNQPGNDDDQIGIKDIDMCGVKITGSDISRKCLDRARQGKYKLHEVRFMPERFREKFMSVTKEAYCVFYQVIEQVRALVHFDSLNLHDLDGCGVPMQDVIFCQNVLMYFKPEQRKAIIGQLCQRLNPGGYLVLAPAEVTRLKHPKISRIHMPETLIYQRKR